jgi:murein DD-endopeptidase MepM/ murein hydrolase activator NlpD
MCNQPLARKISFILFTLIGILVCWPELASAQPPPPFLNAPYYGTKSITSYFDHSYPLNINNNVTYFDGRLGNIAGCDPNFNRAYATATGDCLYYDGHEGVDFGLNYEPIIAAAAGTVSWAGWDNINNRTSGYGLVIEIQHAVNGATYVTRYGHLSSIAVNVNQYVEAGQIIGTSGNTGNSTGAHLHFSVLNQNVQLIDPFGWSGSYSDPYSVAS